MNRNHIFRLFSLIALLLCSVLAGADAAQTNWQAASGNDGTFPPETGKYVWTDGTNWTAGVPGSNDTAFMNRDPTSASNRPILIDLAGATNLDGASGRILGQNNGGEWWTFYNSAVLTPLAGTPTSIKHFAGPTDDASLVAAANSSPAFVVTTIDWQKEANPTFYVPVIVDTLKSPERTGSRYYGDVTAELIDFPRNKGWLSVNTFYADVTADRWNMDHRNDGNEENATIHGQTTVGIINQEGALFNFNDVHVIDEFRQANDAVTNISGRYSGTAEYFRDVNTDGFVGPDPTINLLAGSTLAPGDSIGTLGSTTLDVNATDSGYEWEVGASPSSASAGAGWDLALADNVTLDGTFDFQIVEAGLSESISASDEFAVVGANSIDISGVTGVVFSVIADQLTWDISGAQLAMIQNYAELDGNSANGFEDALVLSGISAQSAVVPEPSTLLLAALGLLGMAGFRRRRANRAG
jgi:hypothetical protein